MSLPENIAPLLEPIFALQRFMDRLGGRGVIIGGVATGFHGKPRLTVDIDAMVLASVDDISKLLILAKEEGIEPRIENVDGFARRNRILLLHHTATKTNIDICVLVMKRLNTISYISQSRLVNSLGDKPGQGNP